MAKIRVYELAKELGIENNKNLLSEIRSLGIEVKGVMSTLTDDEADRVRRVHGASPWVAENAQTPSLKSARALRQIRVYELAKELGIDNKNLVREIRSLGIEVKGVMSSLTDDEADRVRREHGAPHHVAAAPRTPSRKGADTIKVIRRRGAGPRPAVREQEREVGKLIDRLLQRNTTLEVRPIAFVVGAGLSNDHDVGVPDSWGMLEHIRLEMHGRGLAGRLERELADVDSLDQYRTALEFLHHQTGSWLVDVLVEEVVRKARRPDSPVQFDGDGQPEHWHLPSGMVGLARLIVGRPHGLIPVVLTTNFDPLLSLAIEASGGIANLSVVCANGLLERMDAHPQGTNVVHLHGYWRGQPSLRHRPAHLMHSDTLRALVEAQLRGRLVLVLGHRGRAGPVTQALERLATDPHSGTEVYWLFHAHANAAEPSDRLLLDQLQRWGATVLFGNDVHRLFDEIA